MTLVLLFCGLHLEAFDARQFLSTSLKKNRNNRKKIPTCSHHQICLPAHLHCALKFCMPSFSISKSPTFLSKANPFTCDRDLIPSEHHSKICSRVFPQQFLPLYCNTLINTETYCNSSISGKHTIISRSSLTLTLSAKYLSYFLASLACKTPKQKFLFASPLCLLQFSLNQPFTLSAPTRQLLPKP